MSDRDGLPPLICFQCVQQVNRSYTFRQQCERSDTMLRHWFLPIKTPEVPICTEQLLPVNDEEDTTTAMKYINVLLECVSTENQQKSTIMLPIDEAQSLQLLEGKTLYLTEPTDAPIDLDSADIHLNDSIDISTSLSPIPSLTLNSVSSEVNLSSPTLCTVEEFQENEQLNICSVVDEDDDEQFINAQFLSGKMPIIPDAYIEMMNSFEPSNMSNQGDSPVLTPEPDCTLLPIEIEHLNSEQLLNDESQSETLQMSNEISEPVKTDESLVCNVCNKELRGAVALRRHQKTHSREKQYVCQYCNKAFADPSYLTKHIKRHTGDKAYTCTVCKAKFYEPSILKVHMRIHTGEKPFKCLECQKSFAQSNQLETHKLTHNTNRENVCRICKKGKMLPHLGKIHETE